MSADLFRVFVAAVVSRALVLALGLASDWAVADYDTSARWDVPNTSSSCVMSDGDEKVVQARRRRARRGGQAAGAHARASPAERPAGQGVLPRGGGALTAQGCGFAAAALTRRAAAPRRRRTGWRGTRCTSCASRSAATKPKRRTPFSRCCPASCAACSPPVRALLRAPSPEAPPALCADAARAVLSSLMPALYPRCTLALAGFVVSNCAFVVAALVLYWRVRRDAAAQLRRR